MRILAIDSSGSAASCAVLSEEKLEAEIFTNHKLQHSVILFPMIERVLQMVDLTIEDIDAVAVSGGPGSFTGLRIGVATAKGIAQGGGKRFAAISGLDAIAFAQTGFSGIICPMMDALRDNIYFALYKWENAKLVKIHDYDAVHLDELVTLLAQRGEPVMFCGDGAQLHKEAIQAAIENVENRENVKISISINFPVSFAPLATTMPRASSIGELAMRRFLENNVDGDGDDDDDIHTFSPVYLRKSQAEREYERKHGEPVESV